MSDKRAMDLHTRAHWQRWEMDSLETLRARQRTAAQDSPQDPAQQAEALRRRAEALAQARKDAAAQGYQAGFEEGRAQGLAEGQTAGHAEGLAAGREAGQSQGHAEGLAQGLQEGRAQVQAQTARLDALATACAQALNHLEEEVGQSLIQLATRIAEQVLRSQLREHPNHILDLVQDILQARPEPGTPLSLRLHPDDLDLVRTFLQKETDHAQYRLVADERLTRGGCIAETALGSVDATLETRWQRIVSALGQPPRPL
ncbi:flagellar assembly protein FliH [Castellaniella hirudinis]|uniref:flagellar assembly protein FliH n=1 Tax=Castellaniella hirudinis TaxID=1144617 RepID=UPI0039C022C7